MFFIVITNVNTLKASGSATLKTTPNSESPLTINYNSSTIDIAGKNSLDNLMTTYNNIHRYNESSCGALTEKINEHTFGNIFDPVETDIEKYISYEYPTAPTDDKLTPSTRNTPFNIRSNATKYVYLKKDREAPASSVRTSIANPMPASSTIINTFIGGNPTTHAQVTGSTDRYMVFKTATVNHTFSVPSGGLICDILMIGGGGAGNYGGSGGAGACIVAINQTLPTGSCVVNVGAGGADGFGGNDSSITINGTIRYLSKGGGRGGGVNSNGFNGGCGGGAGVINGTPINYNGGSAVATNIVNGITSIGPSVTSTYGVYGNRGGNQRDTNGTAPDGGYAFGAGGGGIGSTGNDNTEGFPRSGDGGNGLNAVTINGTTYNFQNYFNNSVAFGSSGIIGGGGGGANGYTTNVGMHGLTGSTSYNFSPPANTGSGGNGSSGAGSSGIVIIRYRT